MGTFEGLFKGLWTLLGPKMAILGFASVVRGARNAMALITPK